MMTGLIVFGFLTGIVLYIGGVLALATKVQDAFDSVFLPWFITLMGLGIIPLSILAGVTS